MTRQVYAAWRDETAKARYPFDDNSTLVALDGQELPTGLVLDAAIHPPGLTTEVFLSSLEISYAGLVFYIARSDGLVVCQGEWPQRDAIDASVVPLTTQDNSPAGLLVVNVKDATDLLRTRSGELVFSDSATRFVISTIRFVTATDQLTAAQGVRLPEADDVYLVGRNGIQLTCDNGVEASLGSLQDVVNVRVVATGDPLGRRASCADTEFETPRFIREVVFQKDGNTHTCSPAGLGEIFVLSGSFLGNETALRVYKDANTITFGLSGRTSETSQ